jgi:hypothetical protein
LLTKVLEFDEPSIKVIADSVSDDGLFSASKMETTWRTLIWCKEKK